MARKRKTAGSSAAGTRSVAAGQQNEAAASSAESTEAGPGPTAASKAEGGPTNDKVRKDVEKAIELQLGSVVLPADVPQPDNVATNLTAAGVSSSLQAGLAQALRGVKKMAGLQSDQGYCDSNGIRLSDLTEAEITLAKAEDLLKSGATGPAAELLAQSLKLDTTKDGKVSLTFGAPLSNDVLKDMVEQAVSIDGRGTSTALDGSAGADDATAKVAASRSSADPSKHGKKRDSSGGWKVTAKTTTLTAPLKPPGPSSNPDADSDDRIVTAAESALMKQPGQLGTQPKKGILKNAIVKKPSSDKTDGKESNDIVEFDANEEDIDLEEVDSDGVVGVCLHCSRPRTKSKQIKTKSPNDVDVDELVEDALDLSDPTALDSSKRPRAVQVSCDDCHSFICTACHWCHEYQANHEIRVCDRCDAFYCRGCDEMDQCEDCSEVVCGGCSTLMSCKFCGCGLCEDCATACGRCGIVLCSRDAKFAVECDTCRMSYCLVCLASGTKDPCVRCGHRPSKRVEQLVHLRLKSIYKAFKQSGASLGPSKSGDKNVPALEEDFDSKTKGGKAAAAAALARAAGMANLPAGKSKGGNDDFGPDALAGDVGAVLQAAAAAAAAGANSNRRSGHGTHGVDHHGDVHGTGGGKNNFNAYGNEPSSNSNAARRSSNVKSAESDKYAAKTEAEADAAAAALLAELDLEDGKAAATTSKKSKKKKKKEKERAAAAEAEAKAAEESARAKRAEEEAAAKAEEAAYANKKKKKKKKGKGRAPEAERSQSTSRNEEDRAGDDASEASSDEEDLLMLVGGAGAQPTSKSSKKASKASSVAEADSADQSKSNTPSQSNDPSPKNSPVLQPKQPAAKGDDGDGDLSLLTEFVQSRDVAAIEALMESLKGVPGKAAIRKNAKKALKKLKEELGPGYSAPSFAAAQPRKKEQEWVENKIASKSKSKSKKDESPGPPPVLSSKDSSIPGEAGVDVEHDGYLPPEPLLKLVSQTHRTVKDDSGGKSSDHSAPRTETVLHMSPLVVGWVIGRGGTRIRDLMEDSGAKIWIDQDSMGAKEARVVYISGPRKSVDSAVRAMKDLVAKAPVGGGGGPQYPQSPQPKATAPPAALPAMPIKSIPAVTSAPSGVAAAAAATGKIAPPTSFAKAAAAATVAPATGYSAASVPMPTTVPVLTPSALASQPPAASSAPAPPVPASALKTISTSTSKSGIHSHSLTCEPRFVPLLIGRRGWTVKHIQDATGARVDIDQTVSPRKIVVSGSDERAVRSAVRMVRDVLNYPHAVEGEQKDGELPLDDVISAPLDLSGHNLQTQAQAQAIAAILAQQRQQPPPPAVPSTVQLQAALPYSNNTTAYGVQGLLGKDANVPTSIAASQIPLFPQHVNRSGTTGGMPGYPVPQQQDRPLPQSQMERQFSSGLDGIASVQQPLGQFQVQQLQEQQQQQQHGISTSLATSVAAPSRPMGLHSTSIASGLVDDKSTSNSLGLMAKSVSEFSADAPAFQASSAQPSESASLSSSYNAALGGFTSAESTKQAQGIFGAPATASSGNLVGLSNGNLGSSLISTNPIPSQEHDVLGAALANASVKAGSTGQQGATSTAERDIIDDIFGAMSSGDTDPMTGLGGASDWGTSALSGWGAGATNGSQPGQSNLLSDLLGGQQQQQQQQQGSLQDQAQQRPWHA